MNTKIAKPLVLAAVLGTFCGALTLTSARAQTKTTVSAMPIPTHTVPPFGTPKPAIVPEPVQAASGPRPQVEKILFDAADMQGSKPVLSAIWVRAAPINPQQRKPTIIAMHSCGGLYSVIQHDKNLVTPRTAAMARELRNAGYNVLLPDSLTPRGKVSICAESLQQRDVSTAEQARDVQAALRWLAKQDDVDPDRIALLGWDQGASAAMKALAAKPARGTLQIKAGVAFYPSCGQFDPRTIYKPSAPVLILMGEEDDWSPVAACDTLTKKADPTLVKLNVYPDSYHEFDAPGMPLHVRLDVPNPLHPGKGVTSGTNPEAKVAAYHDMLEFLGVALQ
jgi:dienelactone hydrolase